MKLLSAFLFSIFAFSNASSFDPSYQVFQVHPKADISKLKHGKKRYLKHLKRKKKREPSFAHREQFIDSHFAKESASWNQMQRDLLVLRMLHFPKQHFLKTYKKEMKSKDYEKLRGELESYL